MDYQKLIDPTRDPSYQDKMDKIYKRIETLEKLLNQNKVGSTTCKDLAACQKQNQQLQSEINQLISYYKSYSINPNIDIITQKRSGNIIQEKLNPEMYLINPSYKNNEINIGLTPFKYAEIDPSVPNMHIPAYSHLNFVQGPWYGHSPNHSMIPASKDILHNPMPNLHDPYDMLLLAKSGKLPIANNRYPNQEQYIDDVTKYNNLPSYINASEPTTITNNVDTNTVNKMMKTDGIEGFSTLNYQDPIHLIEPTIVLQQPYTLVERAPFGVNKLTPPNVYLRPPIVEPSLTYPDTAYPTRMQVFLYNKPNYYGKRIILQPGTYIGPWTEEISSIKVPAGLRLTLYSQPRRQGERIDFYGSIQVLRLPDKWLGNIQMIDIAFV